MTMFNVLQIKIALPKPIRKCECQWKTFCKKTVIKSFTKEKILINKSMKMSNLLESIMDTNQISKAFSSLIALIIRMWTERKPSTSPRRIQIHLMQEEKLNVK